jgi:hypothetical protein
MKTRILRAMLVLLGSVLTAVLLTATSNGALLEVAQSDDLAAPSHPSLKVFGTPQHIQPIPPFTRTRLPGTQRPVPFQQDYALWDAWLKDVPSPPDALWVDHDDNRVFRPSQLSIVKVRRDTSYGLPYGSVHSTGISSIVWGTAAPDTTLVISLSHASALVVTRTVGTDQVGSFMVSVDRLIQDGDAVEVSDGMTLRIVQVPTITFRADPVARVITGFAPPNITVVTPNAPHSLQISIGGTTRQVTTTLSGAFTADFGSNPYLAGALGAVIYTTPSGDQVYKPLFVADPLMRGQLDRKSVV